MELSDTQKMQVRLLKLGALLIVVLLALFIYLSVATSPDSGDKTVLGSCWQSGNAVRESYAKDRIAVYCGGDVITGADPRTFTVLTASLGDSVGVGVSGIGTDVHAVYVGRVVLPSADVTSFAVVGGNYAKDIRTVYYYSNIGGDVQIVADADPATFQVWTADTDTYVRLFDYMLDPGFAKDKNNYYKEGTVFTGTIPKEVTFAGDAVRMN